MVTLDLNSHNILFRIEGPTYEINRELESIYVETTVDDILFIHFYNNIKDKLNEINNKSDFYNEFIEQWNMYKNNDEFSNDIFDEKELTLNIYLGYNFLHEDYGDDIICVVNRWSVYKWIENIFGRDCDLLEYYVFNDDMTFIVTYYIKNEEELFNFVDIVDKLSQLSKLYSKKRFILKLQSK